MPNTKTANLRYVAYLDLNPDNITPFVYHSFRANSVYDPDQTGLGHQPYGYDQLSTFYPEWVVKGAKISVRMVSADTNAPGIPAFYGVNISNDANMPISSGWNQTTLIEQPGTSWRFIQTGPNSQPSRPAVAKYSPRKWWGIKDVNDNQQFWGQTGSNPNISSFFNVWVAAADGSSDIGSLRGIVTIDYRVQFMNANFLVPS